jgi:hypothetical protein
MAWARAYTWGIDYSVTSSFMLKVKAAEIVASGRFLWDSHD